MKGFKLVIIIGLLLGSLIGNALAVGVDNVDRQPTKDVTIEWAVMNSVTNSASHQNTEGSGITGQVQCTFTVVGTNEMSMWLQTSMDDSTFVNAVSASSDVLSADTDTLMLIANANGGSYWRWHTEDSDVDVTNTVAFSCIFWRK